MNSKNIDRYRNNISFVLSILTAISLYQGYYYNNFFTLKHTINLVFIYCLCDVFFVKSIDYIIHHIFVLLIIFFNYNCNISFKDSQYIMYVLLGTELTNFFFVLTTWFENKQHLLYYVNSILFAVSFFIIRIYIFFNYLIFNLETYLIINRYIHSITDFICIYLGMFGLGFLNIYWSIKILRIMSLKIRKMINKND